MADQTRRRILQSSAFAAGAAALLSRELGAQGPPGAGQGKGKGKGGPAAEIMQIPDLPKREPMWPKLFPAGFKNERVKTTGGTEINCLIGGEGPPLLLMHGAPDSLCTWHLVAPELMKHYTMIMTDHRGYGDSSKPADLPDHSSMSKRPMAQDGVDVMKHFGHTKFRVVGHDRGGRVAHRMARDHADKVQKVLVIDIVPALYLYTHVTIEFVQAYAHWFNYLQPAPGPENTLLAASIAQAQSGRLSGLQDEYNRVNLNPGSAHGMCEDYRASASIDLKYDEEDKKKGVKVKCPLHVLWAAPPGGAMGRLYDVLGIWKQEGNKVTGKALTGGHALQQGNPKETQEEILAFMKD
ncbi:MAG: alpha/beta hydrolase [Bryobacteraceae bacterium]